MKMTSPRRNAGGLPVWLVAVTAIIASLAARAQSEPSTPADPNLANPNELITVAREGYTIAGLVTHLKEMKAAKYGLALFPGSPGILRLRIEDGIPKYGLKGNFLVRSRRHWLDEETLVVVVDAPSDEWTAFDHRFRATPRYGADIGALLGEVGRRYQVQEWTFIGTSEGSVSAYHAARMLPTLAPRLILTASLFQPSGVGPGLSEMKFDQLPARTLWVHHADDPCSYTAYRDAQEFAKRSGKPLLTATGGGPGRGGACQAQTAHGFVGVEIPTIQAMRSWIKTGVVPPDVKP